MVSPLLGLRSGRGEWTEPREDTVVVKEIGQTGADIFSK